MIAYVCPIVLFATLLFFAILCFPRPPPRFGLLLFAVPLSCSRILEGSTSHHSHLFVFFIHAPGRPLAERAWFWNWAAGEGWASRGPESYLGQSRVLQKHHTCLDKSLSLFSLSNHKQQLKLMAKCIAFPFSALMTFTFACSVVWVLPRYHYLQDAKLQDATSSGSMGLLFGWEAACWRRGAWGTCRVRHGWHSTDFAMKSDLGELLRSMRSGQLKNT